MNKFVVLSFVFVLLLCSSVFAQFTVTDKDFIESTSRHFNEDCKRYIDTKVDQTNAYMVGELDRRYEQFTQDYDDMQGWLRGIAIKVVFSIFGAFLLANQLVSFLDLLREKKKKDLLKAMGVDDVSPSSASPSSGNVLSEKVSVAHKASKKGRGRVKVEPVVSSPGVSGSSGRWSRKLRLFVGSVGWAVAFTLFVAGIIYATMYFTGVL